MIHTFSFEGLNIVLDVGSGSVHVVDQMALKAMGMYEDGFSLARIAEELKKIFPDVDGFMAEFQALLEQKALFAPQAPAPAGNKSAVIKALCLHVAHDCNLSCRYCFAGQGSFTGERSLMPIKTGYLAVDFLLKHCGHRKNVEIDFFGGEPLLNFPAIKAITEYAEMAAVKKGKKVAFTVTTNGVLLRGEVARYLQSKAFNVVLSLDGRPEINDHMRPFPGGSGSFAGIVPHMQAFVEERHHKDYYIRGTYTRHNLDFTRDAAYLTELGFKSISLEPVVGGEQEEYSLGLKDAPQLLQEYEKLTRFYLQEKRAGRPFTFFHFNLDLTGGPCLKKRIKGCGAGTEYLAVTPEGHLYPCHQFVGEEGFQMGDLLTGEFDDTLARSFAGATVYTKDQCRACWAKYYCGGGCHANAFKRRGDIRAMDELGCLLEKKRLECSIYLKALEMMEASAAALEGGAGHGSAGIQPGEGTLG
jgi:uncharacterized protein